MPLPDRTRHGGQREKANALPWTLSMVERKVEGSDRPVHVMVPSVWTLSRDNRNSEMQKYL
jgi:hypothetical protein